MLFHSVIWIATFLMCVAFNSFHCFCCFSMMMKFFYLVVLHDKASRHVLLRFVKRIIHLVRSSVSKGSFTYVYVWGCKNCYFFRNFSVRIKGMSPYLIGVMFLLYQSFPFRQKNQNNIRRNKKYFYLNKNFFK